VLSDLTKAASAAAMQNGFVLGSYSVQQRSQRPHQMTRVRPVRQEHLVRWEHSNDSFARRVRGAGWQNARLITRTSTAGMDLNGPRRTAGHRH
jgi:hypothetical protein